MAKTKKKPVAHNLEVFAKTVDTFSGITGRRLILVTERAANSRTNGSTIWIDMENPAAYRILEHEVSHIVFKSDADAREAFIETYSKAIEGVLRNHGIGFDTGGFHAIADSIIGSLEDRRVNSLWAELYPGSAHSLRSFVADDFAERGACTHLLDYLTRLAYNHHDEASDKIFGAYKPIFMQACRSVDRRSFQASLVMTKWLITQLVDLLITPPKPPSNSGGDADSQDGSGEDQDPEQVDGEADADAKPSPNAPRLRAQALSDLINDLNESMGDFSPATNPVAEAPLKSRAAELQALAAAKEALKQSVEDLAKLDESLEKSEAEMEKILDDTRDKLGLQKVDRDDWLRRNVKAKIKFTNIKKSDCKRVPVMVRDKEVVRRLRGHFIRVLGRKSQALDDVGSELDVRSYIDALVSGEAAPFFKSEGTGRGFRALILADRSGSMSGFNHDAVNRACQMLADALRFPFVTFEVWGFNSSGYENDVNIHRYAGNCDGFDTGKSRSDGLTPLHICTKLAIRELLDSSDIKHLFVLTDGQPCFTGANQETMQGEVREAILMGQRFGIGTTGVCIGQAVPNTDMDKMFLGPRHWKRMDERDVGKDLFDLVLRSFNTYIKHR